MSVYDKINQSRKDLVDRIVANLQKGYILPWEKGWNAEALRPQNPVSGALYKGGNRLRLMDQVIMNGYTDPRWVTFKQAKDNEWKIKKGAKGTLCEKWIFTKIEEQINEITGKKEKVEVNLDKPKVSFFYVFNAEQVDGMPELTLLKKEKDEIYEIAENIIKSSPCPIEELAQEKAFYSPPLDKIVLPLKDNFKSYEEYLGTTLHEMGHSTGHETRLNRPILNSFGTPDYAKEELVAELTSLFTKSDLGLNINDSSLKNHSAYIQSWIKVLNEDPNELFRACKSANSASALIINNYQLYMSHSQSETKEVISENELISIKKDFKENGFKCSDKMINNIKKLNHATGKTHTIKQIHKAWTENTYKGSSAEDIVNQIAKDLKSQEIKAVKVPKKAMELSR